MDPEKSIERNFKELGKQFIFCFTVFLPFNFILQKALFIFPLVNFVLLTITILIINFVVVPKVLTLSPVKVPQKLMDDFYNKASVH